MGAQPGTRGENRFPSQSTGHSQTRALWSAEHIASALTRISHEILEASVDTSALLLLGIPTRGVPLADRLGDRLARLGSTTPVGTLDPTPFRDDRDQPGTEPTMTMLPIPLNDRHVVLVDDVLYTGRTIRAALDGLIELGRPASVRLAVLVDRGHRELPIRPDFVGKNIPTSTSEHVAVRLDEIDGHEGVFIQPGAA